MSQSATLYSLSKENFQKVEHKEGNHFNPVEIADGQVTFQDSFMGLEFILLKILGDTEGELIGEIFNPVHYIGTTHADIFGQESDEEFWEMEAAVGFLVPNKVKKLSALLGAVQEDKISKAYNADELNENQVYPNCWTDNEAAEVAFNKTQLLKDFLSIRHFFQHAAEKNHYVLSYVG